MIIYLFRRCLNEKAYFIIWNFYYKYIFLSLGCTVNDHMALLTIYNKSNITITNIKIGNTVITPVLFEGGRVDYYIFWTLKGKLSCGEAESWGYPPYINNKLAIIPRPGTYELRPGQYYFESEIFEVYDEYYITLRCERYYQDCGYEEIDEYADGEYYQE